MNDCIFCKIIKGDIPSYKIYEDDKVYAFLDIASDSYGHTLVVPKKHCTNFLDADDDTVASVMQAVAKISRHYVEDCGFTGVNIANASGESAQQTVFHLHVHIIPRKPDDGLDMWPLKDKMDIDFVKVAQQLAITK